MGIVLVAVVPAVLVPPAIVFAIPVALSRFAPGRWGRAWRGRCSLVTAGDAEHEQARQETCHRVSHSSHGALPYRLMLGRPQAVCLGSTEFAPASDARSHGGLALRPEELSARRAPAAAAAVAVAVPVAVAAAVAAPAVALSSSPGDAR